MKRTQYFAAIPFKYLIAAIVIRAVNIFKNLGKDRFVWSISDVSNSILPDADVRNYHDHDNIRSILKKIPLTEAFDSACEVGCGYGRVISVLKEFANNVVGFERESGLVEIANSLLHEINVVQVEDLDEISNFGTFDLIMTCTVLQHLTDDYSKKLIDTMKSCLRENGYILIIESTDDKLGIVGNANKGAQFLSRPRSVDTYVEWMKPLELFAITKRKLEASYHSDAGSCMLFRSRK
jgi:SAM-dependent methyltransferase